MCMWYRINGELINLSRVVDIYIDGAEDIVFMLDIPVAGTGAGGGYSSDMGFSAAETIITFKNTSKRDECFSKLAKVLDAKTL